MDADTILMTMPMTADGAHDEASESGAAAIAQALAWRDAGHGVALAVVLDTWGSAPCRTGSLLAVNDAGIFCGSVSGGCVETAVIQIALDVIADSTPQRLEFSVDNGRAWEVGLACGGTIHVYVVPLDDADGRSAANYAAVLAHRRQRRTIVMASDLATGAQTLIDPSLPAMDAVQLAAQQAARASRSELTICDGKETFLHVFSPVARLILLGAVHIAQALAPMARLAGFDVIVVDHRQAFATAERFPGTRLLLVPAAEALAQIGLDDATAVVALTHNPELDDPGLVSALASPVFYVAALGSRRTQEKRLARLRDVGVEVSALTRLHGPAGLEIGAANPMEIGVSILAQMIKARRSHSLKEQP